MPLLIVIIGVVLLLLLITVAKFNAFIAFKEYFNLSIKETLFTWTFMETIISVVGLAGVFVLDIFI